MRTQAYLGCDDTHRSIGPLLVFDCFLAASRGDEGLEVLMAATEVAEGEVSTARSSFNDFKRKTGSTISIIHHETDSLLLTCQIFDQSAFNLFQSKVVLIQLRPCSIKE